MKVFSYRIKKNFRLIEDFLIAGYITIKPHSNRKKPLKAMEKC